MYTGIHSDCSNAQTQRRYGVHVFEYIITNIHNRTMRNPTILDQGLSTVHTLADLLDHILPVLLPNEHDTTTTLAHPAQTS